MQTILAIAPDGGAAARVETERVAPITDGSGYDPFGQTWHWTGRRPYERSEDKGYVLQRREEGWTPKNPEELTGAIRPDITVTLPESAGESIAQQVTSLPHDQRYLMTMAAATVILRNMTNNQATATFGDGSQVYIMPGSLDVIPA